MAYKMSIDEAIEVLNDVVRYPDDFTEIQIDAVKISLKGLKDMMRFAVANAELATLNATLIEFVSEVNYTPYSDSNYLSLLESLRSRASAILQDITRPTKRAADLPSAPVGCRCFVSIESYNACPVHGTANR